MTKYAMIWTTNRDYMPGTNAILNALEHYGFPKEIDKYVMVWPDNGFSCTSDYWQQWPEVKAIPVHTDFWPYPMNAYWYMVFADIDLAIRLLDEYDVVLLWGADVCVVNDFSEYFNICHDLGRMIFSHNEQGVQTYRMMSTAEPYGHTWEVPYADIPFFIPRVCKSILQDIMRIQAVEGNMTNRMDGLNYAVRDAGHKPLVLSGMQWVFNVTQSGKVTQRGCQDLYFCNLRLNSFHRKYWSAAFCRTYMTDAGEISRHNHAIFNRMWRFLNSQCRVKWTEGVEVWNGK